MHAKDYFIIILVTIALALSIAAMIFTNSIDSKATQNDQKLRTIEQKFESQNKSVSEIKETLKQNKKSNDEMSNSISDITGSNFVKKEFEKLSKKFSTEDIKKEIIAELEKSVLTDDSLLSPQNLKKLENLIDRKLEEKSARETSEDKKIDLSTLSEKIGLDKSQEDALADELNKIKDEAFQVTKIPRADGTTFLDEVVSALKKTETAQEKIAKILQQTLIEKIPGSNDTYAVRIMKINESAMNTIKLIMDDEQYKKFKRMSIQPLDIKTGYDPFEKFILEVLGQNK